MITYDRVASSPGVDEGALVPRLRAGESSAVAAVVRRYAPGLLAIARSLLRDEEEAAGAVQEGLLAAFESIPTLEETSHIGPWLRRFVVEASVRRLSLRRPEAAGAIGDLLPRFLEDGHHVTMPSAWREPADALMRRAEFRAFFEACVDRLPESHRTVLLLTDAEGLDAAETACLLGIEEAAVKTRLHQARQALVALLEAQLVGGES